MNVIEDNVIEDMDHFRLAIDGPAGSGKSSIAYAVATHLDIMYVDTGAFYRAVAWEALRLNLDIDDPDACDELSYLADRSDISLTSEGLFLNKRLLGLELRLSDVSKAASVVAQYPEVRAAINHKLRQLAEQESVVMDGRDIGTHVLPAADLKIFLTAAVAVRAKRRYDELINLGVTADLGQLTLEIELRDQRDALREHAPLKQASDAIIIDTSSMSLVDVVKKVLTLCKQRASQ